MRSGGTSLCLATGLAVALFALPAAAQITSSDPGPDIPPASDAPMGMDSVERGVQGPAGLFSARVLLHVNMTSGAVGEPVSLAPDLYYAFTDTFQLGLVHNLPMGLQTTPGAGLCLTDDSCPKVYNNIGLDSMIGLAFGDFHFSIHPGFYAIKLADPVWFMLTLGAAAKLHLGEKVAIFLDPQIGIALNERDPDPGNPPNENWLFMPVELQFQLADRVAFKLLSGATGPLDNLSDQVQIPLGFALIVNLSEHLDLGGRFSFDNLLGDNPPGVDAADRRSLALLMHLRF
jgi:hypothetical protein